jgi:5-methylcytosine-specific restriction protein A
LRGTTTERGLGYAWQVNRKRILERDGHVCWLCGRLGADTVDHVIPRARGGTNEDDNLRAAHAKCNYGRREFKGGEGHRKFKDLRQ